MDQHQKQLSSSGPGPEHCPCQFSDYWSQKLKSYIHPHCKKAFSEQDCMIEEVIIKSWVIKKCVWMIWRQIRILVMATIVSKYLFLPSFVFHIVIKSWVSKKCVWMIWCQNIVRIKYYRNKIRLVPLTVWC